MQKLLELLFATKKNVWISTPAPPPELVLLDLEEEPPVSSLDGEEALVTEDGEVGAGPADFLPERIEI